MVGVFAACAGAAGARMSISRKPGFQPIASAASERCRAGGAIRHALDGWRAFKRGERRAEHVGPGVAPIRIRIDRATEDAAEPHRNPGTIEPRVGPVPRCVRPAKIRKIAAKHRVRARQQAEQNDADAVHVAPSRGGPARQHFGCEIEWCARGRLPGRVVGLVAGAEVHEHQPAAVVEHDVLGLDVAMHQARGMDRRNRGTQVHAEPRDFGRRERAAAVERLLERAALDELHPQTDAPVDGLCAVDGDDIWMADAREQPPFLDDGGTRAVIVEDVRAQQLQSDLAIQARIPGAMNVAERAVSDALEDLQMTPTPRFRRRRHTRAPHLPQRRECLELLDERFVRQVLRIDAAPVDRRAVQNGVGDSVEWRWLRVHFEASILENVRRGVSRTDRWRLSLLPRFYSSVRSRQYAQRLRIRHGRSDPPLASV